MNQSNNVHTVRNIVIFAVLVNVLAWLGPVLGGSPLEPGLGFLLWGVAPILTALIMRYALRDRVSMGWRLNLRQWTQLPARHAGAAADDARRPRYRAGDGVGRPQRGRHPGRLRCRRDSNGDHLPRLRPV
ncbi:MAG: hypothetical protein R2856_24335 [Caldilineaceae bacterium]